MKAEIVSIGTELLLGQLVDTNAAYLAAELPTLGIDVYYISQVGDNLSRLAETLRRGWQRSDVIVTTGGLGPTEDDVTREAIAALLGEEMVVQPELEADLRSYFAQRGRTMTESNLKQATLVASARAIPNPVGTAPGWWVAKDGKVIASMPGVPREMRRMWSEEVAPRLHVLRGADEAVIVSRTIKLMGIGESNAEEKIRHLLSSTNPTIGTYAKQDGIHLRLTAKAASAPAARAAIAPMEEKLRQILGPAVYGYDNDTPASVVADLLLGRGLTLAVLEMSTGGYVAHTLAEDARHAAYLKAALVTPTVEALSALGLPAGVLHGGPVADKAAVEALAVAVRQRLGASIGLAVGGEIGEGGAQAGTVHAAINGSDGESRSMSMVFPTLPAEARRLAMLWSLNLLRLRLLGHEAD